jgi:hypothetical protein
MNRLAAFALAALAFLAPGAGLAATAPQPAYVAAPLTAGQLVKGAGAQSVETGDLSGDCSTAGTLITVCAKLSGVSPGYFFAGTDASNLTGTLACGRLPSFSGDATNSGCAITVGKTGGVAFGYFATGTDAANLTGTLATARLPDCQQATSTSAANPGCIGAPSASGTLTASATTLAGDADGLIVLNGSGALTLTLAPDSSIAYPTDTIIVVANVGSLPDAITSTDTIETGIGGAMVTGAVTVPVGGVVSLSKIGTTTWLFSGGASGGLGNVPLQASFTAAATPTGSTFTNGQTGLVLFTPSAGSVLTLQADAYNTAPGTTFTVIIEADNSASTGNTGAGIYVRDAAGKIVTFGTDQSGAASANINYWTSYASFSSNILGVNATQQNWFELKLSGGNFLFYSGRNIGSMVLRDTLSATAFIGTPTSVGIYQFGYNDQSATTFTYWTLGP